MRNQAPERNRGLSIALWIVQALLAITFAGTGVWKLVTPTAALATMIPWAGQVAPSFLIMTAVVDLAGGLGILLPSLTHIQPRLTLLAALGCALLQVCAIVFHASRGELANTPFNVVLVGLSLFVFWGRRSRCPIPARR
jgi:hypothetical protein